MRQFVNSSMRVCFFNRSYWPDLGATGQLLTELAEDLAAHHQCEVTVVTGYPVRSAAQLPSEEVRNGVRIVRAAGSTLDPRRFAGRATNYMTYFASACAAALRLSRMDVVVAMTDPPIIGLAGLLAARRSGARFVYLCEDVFPEVAELLEDFHSGLVNGALNQVNRFLLRHADAIIALGRTMRRRLVEKGADASKVTIIDNWADCRALLPGGKDNPFSRSHGLHDRFVVMHAGNIGLSQTLDIMLDAAERLRGEPEIRFVMIGDGARRGALEGRAREKGLDNVLFLPYQPRDEMTWSYATADVFLVSLKPGLAGYIVPSKVYSILAAGRPYVAAVEETCEVVELTRTHQCGIVVRPGDGAALAARVVELHRDGGLRKMLGEHAREAALEYDRPRQVAAYAELFRRVTALES